MKQVTIIGSGNAFNSDGRANACYLLENTSGQLMLMDMGPTTLYRLKQMSFDFETLDFITFTHFHGDHMAGWPFILLELQLLTNRKRPLHVIGPPGVQAACEAFMEAAYSGLQIKFSLDFREITNEPLHAGDFELRGFPITHRTESTGYQVRGPEGKSFAFSGDSACDEKLFTLVEGIDTAIVELSMEFQTDPPTTHVTLEELILQRDRLKCKRLVLTHIYNDLAAKAQKRGLGEPAYDGMVLEF